MKIEDLRIGNYIQEINEIMTVTGLKDDRIYFTSETINKGVIDLEDAEPIPLTAEWLEKFGFEKVNHIHGYSFWSLDKFQIQEHQTLYRGTQIEHCEFVHQLQNTFRWVKGKELELK